MSTTVSRIIRLMEEIAPPGLAVDKDPIGLAAGHQNRRITKVMVALDATQKVIKRALQNKCQMIITHHPRFYRPIKNLDESDPYALLAADIIRAGISVYCAHTNLDSVQGGVNDILADLVGMKQTREALLPIKDEIQPCGLGRMGQLRTPCTLAILARKIKKATSSPDTAVLGKPDKRISKVVVWSGGGFHTERLTNLTADVVVLGEVDYHTIEIMQQQNIACIALGHAASEEIVVPFLAKRLRNSLPGIKVFTNTSGTAKMWSI